MALPRAQKVFALISSDDRFCSNQLCESELRGVRWSLSGYLALNEQRRDVWERTALRAQNVKVMLSYVKVIKESAVFNVLFASNRKSKPKK